MKKFECVELFEEIFDDVMDEIGADAWYEVFDSSAFDEVQRRIEIAFDEDDVTKVPYFLDWYNEMAEDL